MKDEQLTEGWVTFIRRYFADGGTIDRWMGDCVNNPNNEKKHQMQLNAFELYYRYNSGKWVGRRDLFKMEIHWSMTDLPASMIWENCYDDYQAILQEQRQPQTKQEQPPESTD